MYICIIIIITMITKKWSLRLRVKRKKHLLRLGFLLCESKNRKIGTCSCSSSSGRSFVIIHFNQYTNFIYIQVIQISINLQNCVLLEEVHVIYLRKCFPSCYHPIVLIDSACYVLGLVHAKHLLVQYQRQQ